MAALNGARRQGTVPINIRSLQGCAHSVAAFVGPSGEPPRDRRLPRRSLSRDRALPATRSPKPLNKTTKPFSFSWTEPRELRADPSLWAHVLVPRRHCCSHCLFHEPIVDVARGMKARRAHPGPIESRSSGERCGVRVAWRGMAWHGMAWRWGPRGANPRSEPWRYLPAVLSPFSPRWPTVWPTDTAVHP
jgi:hypothetical protein